MAQTGFSLIARFFGGTQTRRQRLEILMLKPPPQNPSAAHPVPSHGEKLTSGKKRIFMVDDHPVFVQGVRILIEREHDFEFCGHVGSGPQALSEIGRLVPDLLLMDVSIEGSNGIELMKSIKSLHPDLPALFLSMHDELVYAERALRAGGRGYIMKSAPGPQVVAAMRRVLAGDVYLSDALGTRFLGTFLSNGGKLRSRTSVERLTDRELEVFSAIGHGKGTRQIAAELNLSIKTVETHRAHIKEKFCFSSASELARSAVEWVCDNAERS
jgi:DNA-binding NarL/FixJ family response regulator